MDEARAIKPNLDYPAGPTSHLKGFDPPTFTPILVASHITGWTPQFEATDTQLSHPPAQRIQRARAASMQPAALTAKIQRSGAG